MANDASINPYAPPTSDDSQAPENPKPDVLVPFPRPLFSPGQALAATIFGSLAAGVILLQANYRAMGRSGAANKALVLGLVSTAAVIAMGMSLPKSVPSLPVNIAVAFGFYKLFQSLQGELFVINRSAGGSRRSNWLVLLIIVATIVALFTIIFIIFFASGALDGLE